MDFTIITQSTDTAMEYINVGQYLLLTLADLLAINYLGQIIHNQVSYATESICFCKFKRSFYLLHHIDDFLKKPINLLQSTHIRDVVFNTPWHLFGHKFQHCILIMLTCTIKPIVITGGKFFNLGYDKCTAVCKGSKAVFQKFIL